MRIWLFSCSRVTDASGKWISLAVHQPGKGGYWRVSVSIHRSSKIRLSFGPSMAGGKMYWVGRGHWGFWIGLPFLTVGVCGQPPY